MTNRSKATLILVPAVVLGLTFALYSGGRKTPANQPPLSDLNIESLATFKNQFNLASDQVRIVLLLSPT